MKVASETRVEITLSGKEAKDLFDFLHNYKLDYLGDDPFPKATADKLYKELDKVLYPE